MFSFIIQNAKLIIVYIYVYLLYRYRYTSSITKVCISYIYLSLYMCCIHSETSILDLAVYIYIRYIFIWFTVYIYICIDISRIRALTSKYIYIYTYIWHYIMYDKASQISALMKIGSWRVLSFLTCQYGSIESCLSKHLCIYSFIIFVGIHEYIIYRMHILYILSTYKCTCMEDSQKLPPLNHL
jgi:hypothetical protein